MDALARGRDLIRIGTVTLAAVVVFAAMFIWLTDRALTGSTSTVYVHLDAADRLKKSDPVLFRGVPVGEVKELTFGDATGVLVRVLLDRAVPISADASAELRPVDVFGAQSIVLHDGAAAGRLADGDTIPGSAGTDLTGQVQQLSDQAGQLIGEGTLTRVHTSLDNIATATAELQRLLVQTRGLMGEQTSALNTTMANMAATTANLREISDPAELELTLANLETTSANLAALSASLGQATVTLENVLRKVDSGQGTAGRLVNDPALYDQLTVTTANLDSLLVDLKANPGKYVSLSLF